MKKLLSVLCMAILAGGMIFTSCTKNFTITVKSNNDAYGTVTGGGTFAEGTTATLTATPKDGYMFEKWQDGNTENPRTVTVTADMTYTANFVTAAPSAKVTFNNEIWNANDIQAAYYAQYPAWAAAAAQTSLEDLPQAQVGAFVTSGSITAVADDEGGLGDNIAYVEYYNETYLVDGNNNTYGDWWGKNVTLNITNFDATALKLSAKVSGTMFSALEAFVQSAGAVGVNAASTAPMTYEMNNLVMQVPNGKTTLSKKVSGKLVAVK